MLFFVAEVDFGNESVGSDLGFRVRPPAIVWRTSRAHYGARLVVLPGVGGRRRSGEGVVYGFILGEVD